MLRKKHKRVAMRGNDERGLMKLPRDRISVMPIHTLLSCPYAAIGARSYMPERKTFDIDLLIHPDSLDAARASLRSHGGALRRQLPFFHTHLGLEGERWDVPGELPIDILWSNHAWVDDALHATVEDETGVFSAPLWAMVVLKIDASGSQDQGDIAKMLCLASDEALADVRARVAALLPNEVEDVETYISFGRFDVGRDEHGRFEGES